MCIWNTNRDIFLLEVINYKTTKILQTASPVLGSTKDMKIQKIIYLKNLGITAFLEGPVLSSVYNE